MSAGRRPEAADPSAPSGASPGSAAEPGPPTWRDVFEVGSYWTDAHQALFPQALFQMMQEVAWKHAESLGFGYTHLGVQSLLWVLSRIAVEISRIPRWGEVVRVESWPSGTDKLLALRDFCMYDDEERRIARAVSGWLILDAAARRPQRPAPVLRGVNVALTPSQFQSGPQRVRVDTVDWDATRDTEYTAKYSDIDAQNHVNNAQFIAWIFDSLSPEERQAYVPSRIHANFLQEAHLGTPTRIRQAGSASDGSTTHAVYSATTGDPVCTAAIEWGSRKS